MTRAPFTLLTTWLILSGVSVAPSNLFAQTADAQQSEAVEEGHGDEDTDETAEQSEEEKAARERARQRREEESKTTNGGTVFKPSEEISEDVPAPFPIDI